MKHFTNLKGATMFIALLTMLLSFGLESNAKIIKVPNVTQFAKITSESAVLYRLPSLNSGRLMEWNSDGGSFETYSMLMYEDTEKGKYPIGGLEGSYANPFTPIAMTYFLSSRRKTVGIVWKYQTAMSRMSKKLGLRIPIAVSLA